MEEDKNTEDKKQELLPDTETEVEEEEKGEEKEEE